MKHPYLLIITGHSCSGKSTLIKELQKNLTGSYHIGYDKIKWGIAGYDRDRDVELVKNLLRGFLGVILEARICCITDAYLKTEEEYCSLSNHAKTHGYRVLTVKLNCPEDVRLERFRERVTRSKTENISISLTDESIFLENMKKPFYFPEDATVFDTSKTCSVEIAEMIIHSLEENL